jgi:hypothetical protein
MPPLYMKITHLLFMGQIFFKVVFVYVVRVTANKLEIILSFSLPYTLHHIHGLNFMVTNIIIIENLYSY